MNIKNILLISLLFLLNGCSDSPIVKTPKPSEVASNYAQLKYTLDDSYIDFLTEEEKFYAQEIKKQLDIVSGDNPIVSPLRNATAEILKDSLSVEILDEVISENTASVTLQITTIDTDLIAQEILKEIFKNVFVQGLENKPEDIYLNLFKEKIKDNPKLKEEILTIELLKNSDKWQVKDGYKEAHNTMLEETRKEKEKQAKVEADAKINSIIREAKEFEIKKDYAQASTKVVSALKIDPDNEGALEYSEELKGKIAEQKALQDYIPNIEIIEFNAQYFSTYRDDKVPGVQFGVKNNGNKSLKRVEVIVYFYDDNGNAIYEKSYAPISGYNYGGLKELKPNYIDRMEKDEFYRVDGLGSEWSGKAEAVISEIEFSD